jgi:hypothetical protein
VVIEELRTEALDELGDVELLELCNVVVAKLELSDLVSTKVEEDEMLEEDDNVDCGAQPAATWTRLVSSVMVAPRANNPPIILADVSTVIETSARTFPIKVLPVPRVALVPTFQ